MTAEKDHGSFRDPKGFVFWSNNSVYRHVTSAAKLDYDCLMESSLFDRLLSSELIVSHQEVSVNISPIPGAYKVLLPTQVPFISYPHEWCFSQLKDAALLTLEIQKLAVDSGMSLKDASAYNVQFMGGKPVFIDTLSFERWQPGTPWVAYRQFCQHFLAPLALASYCDIRLLNLFKTYMDGIPLDLASKLLPWSTKFKFGIQAHIHLHSASQKKHEHDDKSEIASKKPLPHNAMLALIDSLESAVRSLKWQPAQTEWGSYYEDTNYTNTALKGKLEIVSEFLKMISPSPVSAWDLGANRGVFSRCASDMGIPTVAWDIDPVAVEKNYLEVKKKNEKLLLPLQQDLTNPSPSFGWNLSERKSITNRSPADVGLALALIHHLCIGNNVPLNMVAEFMSQHCRHLIIEFVPKEDSQVQRLLRTREDIFVEYTQENFEDEFACRFELVQKRQVPDSKRTLYLFRPKNP